MQIVTVQTFIIFQTNAVLFERSIHQGILEKLNHSKHKNIKGDITRSFCQSHVNLEYP